MLFAISKKKVALKHQKSNQIKEEEKRKITVNIIRIKSKHHWSGGSQYIVIREI